MKLKLRSILLTLVITLTFIFGSPFGTDFINTLRNEGKYRVAYAAPKASTGGYKSGSFKTTTPKSSSGGFKSGSFFNSNRSSSSSFGGYYENRGYSFSIPFFIPFFGRRSLMGTWFLGGTYQLVKLIVIFAIAYVIIKNIKRRR